MGWYAYYCVYGASSLAIDPSGWQILLVSLIPTQLQAKKLSVICLIFQSDYRHKSRLSESTSACGTAETGGQ